MFGLVGENGKISASSISNIPKFSISNLGEITSAGVYKIEMGGLDYHFALSLNSSLTEEPHNRLFVFFSGYVDRARLSLPVFHRWSWSSQFPGHTLYISDPTLLLSSKLGLGWYIGSKKSNIFPSTISIIKAVSEKLGIADENIVLYGSSGGGFAALRAQSAIPRSSSIVINPQIKLSNFVGNNLSNYLKEFFDGISNEEFSSTMPHLNSIVDHKNKLKKSRIVYVQNTTDTHHVDRHMSLLFPESDSVRCFGEMENVRLVLFSDDRGHDVAEPKSIVPRLVELATETTGSPDAGSFSIIM